MFESVRYLHKTIAEHLTSEVFSLRDAYTQQDLDVWAPLVVHTCRIIGPPSLGYSRELEQQLLRFSPDIVHVHGLWQGPSIATSRLFRKRQTPYVVSPRGMLDPWALSHSRWKKRLAGALFEHRHLRQAACLHALCQSEASSMRRFGLRAPIAIIPNGVSVPNKVGAETDASSANQKQLLFLGRIHPKKGLDELIRGWAKVPKEHRDDWLLIVAGWDDGGYASKLVKTVRDCNVEDSVRFVGPMFGKEKQEVFRASDAFILPSFSEGLPMAILEAWSYSLPVVMTNQCNLPEGFSANAAIPIEPNPDSIANGIVSMIQMRVADRTSMGRSALQLVEREFVWESVAKRMVDTYRWLLGEADRPSFVEVR